MKSPIRPIYAGLAALALGLPLATLGRADDEPKLPEGAEILGRGPVHEAYAQPATDYQTSTVSIEKQPPEPIEEIPPAEKPEGDNVWVPGYWQFDEGRGEFIWVSGLWRAAPPDRVWVPGAWNRAGDRWQWSAGYWAVGDSPDTTYVPPPPEFQDQGPTSEAPGADYTWVPACHVYRESQYVLRPGFWLRHQPGWIWQPCQYVWTPAGHIYCRGYWDYPLGNRGLLFAPVFFPRNVYSQPRFAWQPSYVVNAGFLPSALFVRAASRHYWFGDYFSSRHVRQGYVAWNDYRPFRGSHDPLYGYYRQANARNGNWNRDLSDLYTARYAGSAVAPPRTLTQQARVINNVSNTRVTTNVTNVNNVTVLQTINQASRQNDLRLARVDQAGRDQARERATQLRALTENRRRAEQDLIKRQVAPVRANAAPQRVTVARPNVEAPRRERPRVETPNRPTPRINQQPQPQTPRVETQPRPRPEVPTPRPRENPPARQEAPRPRENPPPRPQAAPQTPPAQPRPRQEVPTPRPQVTPTPQPQPQPRRAETPAPQPRPQVNPTPQPPPRRAETPAPRPQAVPQTPPRRAETPAAPRPQVNPPPQPQVAPQPRRAETPAPQPRPQAAPQPRPAPTPAPRQEAPRPQPQPQRAQPPAQPRREAPPPAQPRRQASPPANTPRPSAAPQQRSQPRQSAPDRPARPGRR